MSEAIPPVYRRQPLPASLRADVWDRSGGVCHYCNKSLHPLRDFHVDHVIPVVKGGTNDHGNLVASCRDCNSSKHTKSAPAFMLPKTTQPRKEKSPLRQKRAPRPRRLAPDGFADSVEVRQLLNLSATRTKQLLDMHGLQSFHWGVDRRMTFYRRVDIEALTEPRR